MRQSGDEFSQKYFHALPRYSFMRFRDIPMHTPKAAVQAAIDPARRQRVTGGPRA
jgi:hypothetical protein